MHYYLVSSKLVLDKKILEIPTYEAKKKQLNVVLPFNSTYLNLVEAEVKKMDQQQEQLQVGKVKVHG